MHTFAGSLSVPHLLRLVSVVSLVAVSVAGSASLATAATPGTQLWARRYNGPGGASFDSAVRAVVSPDGTKVFVTGESTGSTSGQDYLTIAYDASTGAKLWTKRYNGPGNGDERALCVAVSPDGTKVFVTGQSTGSTSGLDYATLAYDASTGAKLWTKRYNGPGNGDDRAFFLAVGPDGTKVFVTGRSTGSTSGLDYLTFAYDASSGAKLWTKRYNGPGNGTDIAQSVAVGLDGTKVFVTGGSFGSTSFSDYYTLAYDASTGAKLWAKRYNGPGNASDSAFRAAVSPDGTKVFVTGGSGVAVTNFQDYATLAYDASTGAKLWTSRYNGPGNLDDGASSLAASPDGTMVFVTGFSFGSTSDYDYATIACDASTGDKLWIRRYNGPGNIDDEAAAVAVGPDGTKVYVTGDSAGSTSGPDYTTFAYDASTGAKVWTKRYNGPANDVDRAFFVAVSPDGTRVFVTGGSAGSTSQSDYATVAYAA